MVRQQLHARVRERPRVLSASRLVLLLAVATALLCSYSLFSVLQHVGQVRQAARERASLTAQGGTVDSQAVVEDDAGEDTALLTAEQQGYVAEAELTDPQWVKKVLRQAQGGACFTDGCNEERDPQPATRVSLLIGVLSDAAADAQLRDAARRTWLRDAHAHQNGTKVVFFFNHTGPVLRSENATHGDIVVAPHGDAALPVGMQMLLHFAQHYPAKLVLRASVRRYVSVPKLMKRISDECSQPLCAHQLIWAGKMIKDREVPPEHAAYKNDTGLDTFLPYMTTDAYVMSHALLRALHLVHATIGLRFWVGGEDVAMALWLLAIPLKRVDMTPAFLTTGACCVNGQVTAPVCRRSSIINRIPTVVTAVVPLQVQLVHNAMTRCPWREPKLE